MAADHPQLSRAPGPRTTALLALALLLPMLAWTAVTAQQVLGHADVTAGFDRHLLRSLLLAQALVLPLLLPWYARDTHWRERLAGPLLLVLAPLPLLVVVGLTATAGPWAWWPAALGLGLAVLVFCSLLRLVALPLRDHALIHMLHTALAWLAAGLAWCFRDLWLGWAGL